MELVQTIKNTMMMRIEDPFWNSNFSENLPKWIHIWITSIGLGTGILFILNTIFPLVDKEQPILRIFAFILTFLAITPFFII